MQSGLPLFLGQLIRYPHRVVALAPSSRALAARMAREVPKNHSGPVIELGAGTGKITQALLDHGVADHDIHAFELNADFVALMRRAFPRVNTHHAPAQEMEQLGLTGARAVVSGLPLLSMPNAVQQEIVESAFKAMGPDGVFVQFTYGPNPPVSDGVRRVMGLTWKKSEKIWGNLPPARVYAFRRNLI
jgi:phosphatidylethanolamine/phosphatidyl-N-methylethanolamine N-methyltransferase